MGFNFESVDAGHYDELRPSYAPEAVRWVAERGRLAAGSLVVDLAAGTGQLARRFVALGVRVRAVEPAANMRAVLRSNHPDVQAVAGTAEDIPLGDGIADAVVVGNAFHHFDAEPALAEIRRVLRPGRVLALFWARSGEGGDVLSSVFREIDDVVGRERASTPIVQAYRSWLEPPSDVDGFTPFERRSFGTTHTVRSSRLADLFATSSDVASLPEAQRTRLLARVRELTSQLPEVLELPGRSDVQLCSRT
jgi:SAM-dependent methyltransferase